ncbi:hypothetical protein GCM10010294_14400 [Streptomyces griseoloalbus]|nr:hypothetical protein GCM10010294_14400 [Streptomyces griseoloalbus]
MRVRQGRAVTAVLAYGFPGLLRRDARAVETAAVATEGRGGRAARRPGAAHDDRRHGSTRAGAALRAAVVTGAGRAGSLARAAAVVAAAVYGDEVNAAARSPGESRAGSVTRVGERVGRVPPGGGPRRCPKRCAGWHA